MTDERDFERAWSTLKSAEAVGCTFAIEDGKLAVEFPETLDPETWADIQQDVLADRLLIAAMVKERSHG